MKKEIEEDTNITCSWIERINILKLSLPPTAIYRFTNSYQDTNGIFRSNRTNTPKMYMGPKKTPNNHSNLEKEEQS